MAYLRVENLRFLFFEGSVGTEAAADVATIALPDASAARAGTSVAHPAAGTSTPAPGTCSSAVSAALGEGGAGSHLSGGLPPSLSSSSSSPDDEYSDVAGGESPCCSRSQNSSLLCFRRSRRCAAHALGLGAWVGRTARRSRPPSAGKNEMSESRRHVAEE
jgi:hypothetical protein